MIYIQFWTRRKQLKTLCSLLLVLSFAPRGFSPGTPVFPSPQKPILPNSNSTRNQVDEDDFVDVLPLNHYLFILFITCTFKVEEN